MHHKKVYKGLDLLKFVMALAVVAIHVKPFTDLALLDRIAQPILSVAVPIFFLITSFLFFRKNYSLKPNERIGALIRYFNRIATLYIVWFFLDIGYILLRKGYFSSGVDGIVKLLKDVVFASTFPGSWFLSASVFAIVVVWFLSRIIGSRMTFVLSLSVSLYLSFARDGLLSLTMQVPYDWYATNIRKEVWLSFPSAMVWISLGECFANPLNYHTWEVWGKKKYKLIVLLLMIMYVVAVLGLSYTQYLFVPLLFILSCCLDLTDSGIYYYLRNSSILIFFSHFWIAGKKDVFFRMIGSSEPVLHVFFYLIVLMICFVFAMLILKMEKRGLSFLKYLH